MKKTLIIIVLLCTSFASAQIKVTKEGYPKFENKQPTTTVAATDTLMISKVEGIQMGISFADFTSTIAVGEILTFGPGVTKTGTNVTLDNAFTATDRNNLETNNTKISLSQLTGNESVFDGWDKNVSDDTQTAIGVPFTPNGSIAATNVQSAIQEVRDEAVTSTATSTVLGTTKLRYDPVQTVAANAATTTASRSYGIQNNASGQMIVNVPWVNTTYSEISAANLANLTGTTTGLISGRRINDLLASKGYSTGAHTIDTDDQTAIEVPFDPSGGYTALVGDKITLGSTNVEAALKELNVIKGSYLVLSGNILTLRSRSTTLSSVDLSPYLAGSVQNPWGLKVTKNVDFTISDADSYDATTGRKKISEINDLGTTVATISNTGTSDDNIWAFRTNSATDVVNVVPDTGVTLNWNGKTTEDAATLTGIAGGVMIVRKRAANDFFIDGEFTGYTTAPPVFSPNNLAIRQSYSNADNGGTGLIETGWTTFQGSTLAGVADGGTGGSAGGSTYAMRAQKTTTGNGLYTAIRYDMSTLGLVNGTVYDIIIDVKYVTAPATSGLLEYQIAGATLGASGNFTSTGGQTTYTTYTKTFTAGASMGLLDIYLGTPNTDTISVDVLFKNFRILPTGLTN